MKNFKITLYNGNFGMPKEIMAVKDSMTIAADKIDDKEILESAKHLVSIHNMEFEPCFRVMMDDEGRHIDFGSWSNFIYIEEI